MKLKAFTLIELLIVVAIIAILAAIAVPNFLEAQTRSKAARCKADMRSMKTAIESYRMDNTNYPEGIGYAEGMAQYRLVRITTPIAYMTSIPNDPFQTRMVGGQPGDKPSFIYLLHKYHNNDVGGGWALGGLYSSKPSWLVWNPGYIPKWVLISKGPLQSEATSNYIYAIPYDPTNGTTSFGELFSYQ
ncbi:MAG: type II secretion system protein GspG [bacterium]